MSKKHQQQNREEQQSQEGVIAGEDQSTVLDEQSTTSDAGAETLQEPSGEEQSTTPVEQEPADEEQSAKPAVLGIGQFVRHMLKNSTKTNAEILELTLKTFEGSKTTAACIAWYKTDMRKKGLLTGGVQRGRAKTVELSAEQLAELVK